MTQPWSSGDLPPDQGAACSPVTLIEGSTFCISELGGDIVPDRSQGLFVRDTRMLSRWELTVDGIEPQPLSVQTQSRTRPRSSAGCRRGQARPTARCS